MPELPEVETSRLGISPHISQQVLRKLIVRNASLRWPVPVEAITAVVGETLSKVERRGKYLKLIFSSGYVLLHLGMSGNLRIVDSLAVAAKHDHIDFVFANGKVLRLNDPRRFGCCLWVADIKASHPLLDKMGPEPLGDAFSFDYFYQASRKSQKAVKLWLMDSQMVVGVGNIYAAESLFKAGIHPEQIAASISKKRLQNLHAQVLSTLQAAILQGGTSLKDFVGSDGKPGYFKQQLQVYGRESEPCYHCQSPIKNIKLGQRSSFYCAKCQKKPVKS